MTFQGSLRGFQQSLRRFPESLIFRWSYKEVPGVIAEVVLEYSTMFQESFPLVFEGVHGAINSFQGS